MLIRDIMTKDPACCTPDTPLTEVARLMLTHDCGAIPVCEGADSRRVSGVVTDRDITVRVVAAKKDPNRVTAGEVMSHPVAVVHVEESLEQALKTMEANQIRRAPVVDGAGCLAGIVAQADIARVGAPQQVAELVQEVSQGPEIGHQT